MSLVYLIAAIAGLLLGPAIYAALHRRPRPASMLDGFVLVSVVALVILHVVPDAIETLGLWVAPALFAGVVLPIAMERARGLSSDASHAAVLALAFVALLIHTAIDGVGLATAGGAAGLSLAIAFHRLPVGLAIWWLVRPEFGPRWGWFVLATASLATFAGYGFGDSFAAAASSAAVQFVQVFVAGSLLHVLMHQSIGLHDHAHDEGWRIPGAIGAVAGGIVALVLPTTGHHHSPGEELLHITHAASPLLVILYGIGFGVLWRQRRGEFRERALAALDEAAPWTAFALAVAFLFGAEVHIDASPLHWLSSLTLSTLLLLSLSHQGPRDFLLHLVWLPTHDHDHEDAHRHHVHPVHPTGTEPVPEAS